MDENRVFSPFRQNQNARHLAQRNVQERSRLVTKNIAQTRAIPRTVQNEIISILNRTSVRIQNGHRWFLRHKIEIHGGFHSSLLGRIVSLMSTNDDTVERLNGNDTGLWISRI